MAEAEGQLLQHPDLCCVAKCADADVHSLCRGHSRPRQVSQSEITARATIAQSCKWPGSMTIHPQTVLVPWN
jgi:hypothetical protein